VPKGVEASAQLPSNSPSGERPCHSAAEIQSWLEEANQKLISVFGSRTPKAEEPSSVGEVLAAALTIGSSKGSAAVGNAVEPERYAGIAVSAIDNSQKDNVSTDANTNADGVAHLSHADAFGPGGTVLLSPSAHEPVASMEQPAPDAAADAAGGYDYTSGSAAPAAGTARSAAMGESQKGGTALMHSGASASNRSLPEAAPIESPKDAHALTGTGKTPTAAGVALGTSRASSRNNLGETCASYEDDFEDDEDGDPQEDDPEESFASDS
jgi:hypothetical protein